MLLLRKIVFYIFSLIYLILCPLIVARMLGFVFNPLTYRLEKTGLVYVSTNPPDAVVFIDGRLAHQKTPAVIRDLTPGNHFIRIELNGYNDWERTIPIVGKRATVLANTLLIPEEWPLMIILKGIIVQELFPGLIGNESLALATEVFLVSETGKKIIREGDWKSIPDYILRGKGQGMVSMRDSIDALVNKGIIDIGYSKEFLS